MKNILLIMPLSYGYNKIIIESIEKRGYNVVFIPDFDESVSKRVFRKFFDINKWQKSYLKSKIKKLVKSDVDYILIIRGYNYSCDIIKYLKQRFPTSRMTLYQWDPLVVSRFDEKGIAYFNDTFSFDRADCEKYGFKYLPLFYKKKDYKEEEVFYDFSFIGSGHSQRLFVIGNLIKELELKGYNYYIKIYINKLEYFRGCLLNMPGYRTFPKSNISFYPIDKSFSELVVKQSKVVIDVNHPSQTGLSIRIIEVLGDGKKIITTNKDVKKELFYNSKVIGIIENSCLPSNIEDLLLDDSFINVDEYEIDNWITKLLPL